jgi:hypothetical protein
MFMLQLPTALDAVYEIVSSNLNPSREGGNTFSKEIVAEKSNSFTLFVINDP